VQILELVGAISSEETGKLRFLFTSKKEAVAEDLTAISPKLGKELSKLSPSSTSTHWKPAAVYPVARKICFELSSTVSPFKLRRLLAEFKGEDIAKLFCFAAWISPVTPDYSDIGCFSDSSLAHVYRQAATQMPKACHLLFVASHMCSLFYGTCDLLLTTCIVCCMRAVHRMPRVLSAASWSRVFSVVCQRVFDCS
jgi:hypothetical protein